MLHLLLDPSASVQKMAYDLLREAAHKRTEHLVIEAGVDTESVVKSLLPGELVSLLQQSLEIMDVEEDPSSVRRGSRRWLSSTNSVVENVRNLTWLDDYSGFVHKCGEQPRLPPSSASTIRATSAVHEGQVWIFGTPTRT
jgi:hypothetical protein